MKNIFMEQSNTECVGQTAPRPFFKKSKLRQESEILYSLFLWYIQVKEHQNILKLTYAISLLYLITAFLKNKKRSGTSLSASFSA